MAGRHYDLTPAEDPKVQFNEALWLKVREWPMFEDIAPLTWAIKDLAELVTPLSPDRWPGTPWFTGDLGVRVRPVKDIPERLSVGVPGSRVIIVVFISFKRMMPTCWNFGMKGHIRPECQEEPRDRRPPAVGT